MASLLSGLHVMFWICCFCTGDTSVVVSSGAMGNWEASGSGFGYAKDGTLTAPGAFGRWWVNTTTVPRRVSGFLDFANVAIPNAATITSAKVVIEDAAWVYGDNAVSPFSPSSAAGSADCDIYGEDADDSTTITSASQADGLTRTTASVSYSIDAAQYQDGDYFEITGLASIIQEIVNRPGWSSGNDLQLLFDENGSSYDTTSPHDWATFANACSTIFIPAGSIWAFPELHVLYS